MNLASPVTSIPMVGDAYARKLKKLEISNVKDLLFHTPSRFIDFSQTASIKSLRVGEFYTVKGVVQSKVNQYSKRGVRMQIVNIADDTGSVSAVWFNQPFILRNFKKESEVFIAGKCEFFGRKLAFISPEYELAQASSSGLHTGRLVPIYPETAGVSSKWLRSRINASLNKLEPKDDYMPDKIRQEFGLIELSDAIKKAHLPDSLKQQEDGVYRLAFDEMFTVQLVNMKKKRARKAKRSVRLSVEPQVMIDFINSLPFTLTTSQQLAINELVADLDKNEPMNRLLQGDVGSGKTVVASAGCLIAHANDCVSLVMAPTQLLATQHFNTLKNTFKKTEIRLALLTGSEKSGNVDEADIIVGTHALIFKRKYKKVGFIVVDEQHRFGVSQRSKLIKLTKQENLTPHILNMTATPIPRTAALTFYGDQDLSVLDELPKGRRKITTWIVPEKKREGGYAWIKEKITNEKAQVYIVCPLIEESENESMAQVKAATHEFENLKNEFGKNIKLALLHGKLKDKQKNEILNDFKEGRIDILVTTPVIEVGIDVPNATIMLIEAAERFGLAQLHQLRGRVGRSDKKSYCLLFASDNNTSNPRLVAMTKSNSGFELSELDLKLRGPGEVYGLRQHGFPKLKNADWTDFELVKNAKKAAELVTSSENLYSELMSHYLFNDTY